MPAKATQVPSQNFSLGTTITLAAGHLLNDFYYNFLPILLPIIMPKLGLSLTMSGLLIMVYAITSNLLQPFSASSSTDGILENSCFFPSSPSAPSA